MTVNKKLVRNIIIGVVLIAVLCGAYMFVLNWEPPAEETEEVSPKDAIYAVNTDGMNIVEIKVKNESGEYLLTCDEKDGDKKYDISPSDSEDKNMSAISSSFNFFKKIYAGREITSQNDGFGFGEDKVLITLKADNGDKIELEFGNAVLGDAEYYCLNKNENKVYTVSDTVYALATQPIDYYRNKNIISIDDVSKVSGLEIYENGQLKIKIRQETPEESKSRVMADPWTMEYPWNSELDNDKTAELFTSLSYISGEGFSEDKHSYKYKFNIDAGDKKYSLEVAEGDGVSYVKNSENGIVYVTDHSLYETLHGAEPSKYISKFVNLVNIEGVKKVIVKSGDKEYLMEISDGKYKINGADTDEKDFKAKYQEIIGLSFIEYVEDSPKGEPYMTIDFEMNDGNILSTKIYDYTEREYLAVCMGGAKAKLLKNDLRGIEELM